MIVGQVIVGQQISVNRPEPLASIKEILIQKKEQSFITIDALKVITERNKSYKELQVAIKNKSSHIQDLQHNYKTLRNKCTSLVRIAKENFYSNLINDNKNIFYHKTFIY